CKAAHTNLSRTAASGCQTGLVAVGVRQQRQITRALDCGGQLALIAGPGTGNTARHNLTGLGDVVAQGVEILVVDLLHAFGGETAKLATTKETGHGAKLLSTSCGHPGRRVLAKWAAATTRCLLATCGTPATPKPWPGKPGLLQAFRAYPPAAVRRRRAPRHPRCGRGANARRDRRRAHPDRRAPPCSWQAETARSRPRHEARSYCESRRR